jgi:hypothetical protein
VRTGRESAVESVAYRYQMWLHVMIKMLLLNQFAITLEIIRIGWNGYLPRQIVR